MTTFIVAVICLIVGAIGGIGLYWYFVVHRKKISIPEDITVEKVAEAIKK